jgi:hypothetical protein
VHFVSASLPDEEYEFAGQERQVLLKTAPTASENLPAAQTLHDLASKSSANFPASQFEQNMLDLPSRKSGKSGKSKS